MFQGQLLEISMKQSTKLSEVEYEVVEDYKIQSQMYKHLKCVSEKRRINLIKSQLMLPQACLLANQTQQFTFVTHAGGVGSNPGVAKL